MILFIIYFLGIIISVAILYYVVKAAVRNALKEANADKELSVFIKENKQDLTTNLEQRKLQQRYDKGEITFEVYQTEWKKLNT